MSWFSSSTLDVVRSRKFLVLLIRWSSFRFPIPRSSYSLQQNEEIYSFVLSSDLHRFILSLFLSFLIIPSISISGSNGIYWILFWVELRLFQVKVCTYYRFSFSAWDVWSLICSAIRNRNVCHSLPILFLSFTHSLTLFILWFPPLSPCSSTCFVFVFSFIQLGVHLSSERASSALKREMTCLPLAKFRKLK